MAGGRGTRLLPYTAVLPKPLMPVGEMPILELVLRRLRNHGFDEVILAVNHMHHLIRSFFGNGNFLGMNIEYFVEDRPLGTCGAVAANLSRLPDDFLLMNGDVMTDIDFADLMETHLQGDAGATMATYERSLKIDFGVLDVAEDGRVQRYVEKPETRHKMVMGIYALRRTDLEPLVDPGRALDMPTLVSALIESGRIVQDYPHDGLWLDIGTPDDCARAQSLSDSDLSALLAPRIVDDLSTMAQARLRA